jgi:uncharacterized protein DUF4416
MSRLKEPRPVYLFTAIIYKPDSELSGCKRALVGELGAADFESVVLPFDGTAYYENEMGPDLRRKIVTFKKLIPREDIREIKIFTTALEERFSESGKRTINIDPGYIAQEHVILATGKGFAHRPYVGKGVYADLTLIYRGNEYTSLEWTYPDYGDTEMRGFFKRLRSEYINKLVPD